jgi:hypothetical protein
MPMAVTEQFLQGGLVLCQMVREEHSKELLAICESSAELIVVCSAVVREAIKVRGVPGLSHLASVGGRQPLTTGFRGRLGAAAVRLEHVPKRRIHA